jgi:hypothetical protein
VVSKINFKILKMSEVKDRFYEILAPKIIGLGFEYKKSKTSFVKIENGLEYQINFRWDGRGGTTMMDAIEVQINDIAIQHAIKKRTKRNGLPHFFLDWGYCSANTVKIPVMYSQATLNLANNMNFKALSLMPQDEKYPPARILNSANFVENLIVNQVLPFFEKYKNSTDIYHYWYERAEKNPNSINFTDSIKDVFEEYSKKLGLPEIPELLE